MNEDQDKGKAPEQFPSPPDEHHESAPQPDTANVSSTRHMTTTSSPASQIPSTPSLTTASTLESASGSVIADPASAARPNAASGRGILSTPHSGLPPAASSSNAATSTLPPSGAPTSETPASSASAPTTSTLPSSTPTTATTSTTTTTTLESEERSARELCRYFNLQVNDNQTVEEALETVKELMQDPWFRRTRPRAMGWMDQQLWIRLRETAIVKLQRVVERRNRLAEGEDNDGEDSGESAEDKDDDEREDYGEKRRSSI
ncbi:hypothetical protein BJY00DRAFT_317528 [Aspergillus carlsbadensis]|nr:hypothetical protein BJY00DRAFT_317528 [Aspergillus carlsbadensis]